MRSLTRYIWGFISSFFYVQSDWFYHDLKYVLRTVVDKAAATIAMVVPVAEWKLVERIHSMRVRTSLGVNMLNGRHPGQIAPTCS